MLSLSQLSRYGKSLATKLCSCKMIGLIAIGEGKPTNSDQSLTFLDPSMYLCPGGFLNWHEMQRPVLTIDSGFVYYNSSPLQTHSCKPENIFLESSTRH